MILRRQDANSGRSNSSPLGRGQGEGGSAVERASRPSSSLDTRVIYRGDCLEQLEELSPACIDLIDIDPPFSSSLSLRAEGNSNRNHEVFQIAQHEPRPSGSGFLPTFDDRHACTQAYIDSMRPRCAELARVFKPTGSFYYHCDRHASQSVKVTAADRQSSRCSTRARIARKARTSTCRMLYP